MKILVVSDTHGDISKVKNVFNKLNKEGAPVDLIVHCGDHDKDAYELKNELAIKVLSVKGNCDGSFNDDDFALLETEYGDFFVSHGHMQDVEYSTERLYYSALEQGAIGAIFGHTHRAIYTETNGFYLMNPGSITKPRDGSSGTFGVLITSEETVWGKIYDYNKFMNSEDPGKGPGPARMKIETGHLSSLLNYSDRF